MVSLHATSVGMSPAETGQPKSDAVEKEETGGTFAGADIDEEETAMPELPAEPSPLPESSLEKSPVTLNPTMAPSATPQEPLVESPEQSGDEQGLPRQEIKDDHFVIIKDFAELKEALTGSNNLTTIYLAGDIANENGGIRVNKHHDCRISAG